ncbi:copper chaperone PCu(A)C [Wenzhouxiangella sp. XN201]|uniref:copper chaperone PCu(A)C n=1 Tax=Wenzhouxiangella sp. XN201 TaxID=2710755 RepID=UPI0013C8DA1A|nr:copper chaperone PCu(A)C [Wenzhouxiangella sp. XN201]NEZ03394.1 copper chaperone PCu(A)C [Wenzhouxiangella sp. XN201]
MPTRLPTLLACLLFATGLSAGDTTDLSFSEAWSPEAPPGRTMAGFVTIRNSGDRDIELVAGNSPQFARVEFHTMSMNEGMMRMRRLETLIVPAGETVELAPRGLHLMLFEPRQRLTAGDTIEIELIDAGGERHAYSAEVRQR